MILGQPIIWGSVKPKPIANIPFEAIGLQLDISPGKPAEAIITFSDRTERRLLQPWRTPYGPFWKLGPLTSSQSAISNLQSAIR